MLFYFTKGGEKMKSKNFVVKNQTEKTAEVYIYGDIVSEAFWDTETDPKGVNELLASLEGKDLTLYINSNGGDVFAGTAIYNMLKRFNGKITARVDGLAASIASMILMSADEIEVPENAYIMVHRPTCGTYGNSDDLMRYAELLEGIEDNLVEAYKEHSTLSDEALKDFIYKETWFSGKEFINHFNKGVKTLAPISAVACVSELKYKETPKNLIYESTEAKEKAEKEKAIALALALI